MLAVYHVTEHWDPNGGIRGRTEGTKGVFNPIGRTTISTDQIIPELPETKPPTKEYTWRDTWLQLHIPEDALMWHQWERPWSYKGLMPQCRNDC